MRIWDSRHLKEPILMTHTEGGVWRVKWVHDKNLKTDHNIITAACIKYYLYSFII